MQTKDWLRFVLTFLVISSAFPLQIQGEMQMTLIEEYKGVIREQKPHGLFHSSIELIKGGFSPEQVTALKDLVKKMESLAAYRDGLENLIILDLYEKGNYAALLNDAQDYIARYPQGDPTFRPHMLFNMAEAYYYQEQYQDAMLRYRELMDDYPASEVYEYAHHGLAWCLMHLGRYDEARTVFKDTFRPVSPDLIISTFYGQGINEFNSGRFDEAIRYFFDDKEYQQIPVEGIWGPLAKSLVPKNLYYKGLAYDRLGEQATALQYLRRVADDYPNHPKALSATYLVGWLSFSTENYDLAVLYFNKALSLVKDSSAIRDIRINLSQAYYNSGRLNDAIDNWKLIRKGWGAASANTGLDMCYSRLAAEALAGNYGILPTDSLENLLKNFAQDVPNSKDLPIYQMQLATRFYDEAKYEKCLAWTALATASQASEDVIKSSRSLRLYCFYPLKDWDKLITEGERFKSQYVSDFTWDMALMLGVAYASKAQSIKSASPTESKDMFRKAITMLEDYLARAPAAESNREWATKLRDDCRLQTQ